MSCRDLEADQILLSPSEWLGSNLQELNSVIESKNVIKNKRGRERAE